MNFTGQVPETWPKANLTPNARVILEKRYLKQENGQAIESAEDMLFRVASVIADIEEKLYSKDKQESHL